MEQQALDVRMDTSRRALAAVPWVTPLVAIALVLFMAFYHLVEYPVIWFDEGSYLHVPKALIQTGVYADYSSDGFRYYGPSVGVGPTVLLPVAGMFKLFGVGLLQARLVVSVFLVATILVFFRLASFLGGRRLAWIAAALLVSSRGVSLLMYGREVLGEVPGLFFLLSGFAVWFSSWERSSWRRLALAGILLGLAAVTKDQYLLIAGPALLAAWLANLFYYRSASQRVFLIPGLVALGCFLLWQVVMVIYLGPANARQNFALLRQTTAGAALVFSPSLMASSLAQLAGLQVYLGLLLPVLVYGALLVLPRRKQAHQWFVLYILVVFNLVWFVVASIGWIRYAFPGLALASLFVARFFSDLTAGFRLDIPALWAGIRKRQSTLGRPALQAAFLLWLAVMIALPFGQTLKEIVLPPPNDAQAMAEYLDAHIPKNVIVETWEPEMEFLTDHLYHSPPNSLLASAVAFIWQGGNWPRDNYHYLQEAHPKYILIGNFAKWVLLYPAAILNTQYTIIKTVGAYDLYVRNP